MTEKEKIQNFVKEIKNLKETYIDTGILPIELPAMEIKPLTNFRSCSESDLLLKEFDTSAKFQCIDNDNKNISLKLLKIRKG